MEVNETKRNYSRRPLVSQRTDTRRDSSDKGMVKREDSERVGDDVDLIQSLSETELESLICLILANVRERRSERRDKREGKGGKS